MNPRATNRMVEKNSALAVEYPWIISTTSRAMGSMNERPTRCKTPKILSFIKLPPMTQYG